MLACRRLTVRVHATPPLETHSANRRALAQEARTAIAGRLGATRVEAVDIGSGVALAGVAVG